MTEMSTAAPIYNKNLQKSETNSVLLKLGI